MIQLRKTSSFTKLTILNLLLIMMLSFNTSHAQATASGEALATVLAGLAVVAVQDLQFGNVLQGVAKSVANDDAVNAGIFTITGEGGSGISVFLSLPEYLATAARHALAGPPGPVLLELPTDVLAEEIDTNDVQHHPWPTRQAPAAEAKEIERAAAMISFWISSVCSMKVVAASATSSLAAASSASLTVQANLCCLATICSG